MAHLKKLCYPREVLDSTQNMGTGFLHNFSFKQMLDCVTKMNLQRTHEVWCLSKMEILLTFY